MSQAKVKPRVIERLVKLPLTPAQVEGPFFVPDAPITYNAIPARDKGDIISLRGQLLSVSGQAIPNAVIHFWLANTKGAYDNQNDRGEAVSIPPRRYKNRVRVITDRHGCYRLDCLRPGNYPLENEPVDVRPGHIHARIEADGFERLVTQLYFLDDAYNQNDIPRDGFFRPELVVHLLPALPIKGQVQHGVFNFVLAPAA